jgi:hypothetical protein
MEYASKWILFHGFQIFAERVATTSFQTLLQSFVQGFGSQSDFQSISKSRELTANQFLLKQ